MASNPSTTPARPRYATKAEWAAAKAKEHWDLYHEVKYTSSGGSTCKAAAKFERLQRIQSEAQRYEQMARRFRAKGQ